MKLNAGKWRVLHFGRNKAKRYYKLTKFQKWSENREIWVEKYMVKYT